MLDIHVVSHTHWDREWYLTHEQFRFRLVALIDRLLDLLDSDPAYKYSISTARRSFSRTTSRSAPSRKPGCARRSPPAAS